MLNLGRCTKCMRVSLQWAVELWILFGIVALIGPNAVLQALLGFGALAFTGCWFLLVTLKAVTWTIRAKKRIAAGIMPLL